MSVLKSYQAESDAEFLATARKLELETRRRCVNGPKRYTFYGLQELWQTSRRIYSGVKRANSIFPTNQHEAQIRRDCLLNAKADIQDFNSQMELLMEDGILPPKAIEEMAKLAGAEDRLIKGLMKSDKARYAKLS